MRDRRCERIDGRKSCRYEQIDGQRSWARVNGSNRFLRGGPREWHGPSTGEDRRSAVVDASGSTVRNPGFDKWRTVGHVARPEMWLPPLQTGGSHIKTPY
eukprot:533765-Prorocentrum_minimum.AAC.1